MRTQVNEVPESHQPMSILEISRNSAIQTGKQVDGTKPRDKSQEKPINRAPESINTKVIDTNFAPVSYNSVQAGTQIKMIEQEAVASDLFTPRVTAQREFFELFTTVQKP